MTPITLTEADRIELPAPQHAGRHILLDDGTVVDTLDGNGHPVVIRAERFAYLLPEIKVAQPEKPPGMVYCRVGNAHAWCYSAGGWGANAITLNGSPVRVASMNLDDLTIIPNPHNDPALEYAIRAAQEDT